jgi:predicted phosphate transport protein (TIGR00153 family)
MALTRDELFWNAFSSHIEKTVQATKIMTELLEDPTKAVLLSVEIGKLESEGDRITHETVAALHATWITPLDREEIHDLIARLDDVLDNVEAASERFVLYEIKEVREDAVALSKVLHEMALVLQQAIGALRTIKDSQKLLDLCKAIGRKEREADASYRNGIAKLFKMGGDPLEVLKWRDVFESLENACDRGSDVANIVEGIVLEHA